MRELNCNPPLVKTSGPDGDQLDYTGGQVELIRITGPLASGLYPGQRQLVDPLANPPAPSDVESIWVVEAAAGTLNTGVYYNAQYAGVVNSLRLFIVASASTGTPTSSPTEVALSTGTISALSGTTPGSGPADMYKLSGGNLVTTGVSVTAYNTAQNTYPSGTWLELIQEPVSEAWFICGAFSSTVNIVLLLLQYTQFNITLATYTNYNLAGQSKVRFTATRSTTINGFTGLVDGQIVFLLNTSAFPVTINTSFNVACPWATAYVLWPGQEIILQYDGIAAVLRFATPTMAAGNTSAVLTSGCSLIKAGANMTSVDNGDSSNTFNAVVGTAYALTVENVNAPLHAVVNPSVVKANNDLADTAKYARIHWDGTAFDFQGLIAYLAGTGSVGPFIDFEFDNSGSVQFTISLDPAASSPTGRDSLKLTANAPAASLANGTIGLLSAYTVTSAYVTVNDGAGHNVQVTLPNAGTYILTAQVAGQWQSLSAMPVIMYAHLFDVTASVSINLSTNTPVVQQLSGQATNTATATISVLYTSPGVNHVIALQAGAPGLGVSVGVLLANVTNLYYVQVA